MAYGLLWPVYNTDIKAQRQTNCSSIALTLSMTPNILYQASTLSVNTELQRAQKHSNNVVRYRSLSTSCGSVNHTAAQPQDINTELTASLDLTISPPPTAATSLFFPSLRHFI